MSKRQKGRHVAWKDLSSEQMKEVLVLYPMSLRTGGFRHELWSYLIMPDGRLTRAKGLHQLTEEGKKVFEKESQSVWALPPRPDKGDLSGWTSGVTFHFSNG